MINKNLFTLELDKILKIISQYASTDAGRNKILETKPLGEKGKIQSELNLVEEMLEASLNLKISISFDFENIIFLLDKAEKLHTLTTFELLKLTKFLKAVIITKKSFSLLTSGYLPNLTQIVKNIFTDEAYVSRTTDIITPDGELKNKASPTLGKLRKAIKSKQERIKNSIKKYLSSKDFSLYLQDNLYTIRNNRYVFPVKTEYKSQFPGLIHDKSDSGATIYVEPNVLVELNNDLLELQIEEEREINKILHELTSIIKQNYKSLVHAFELMTYLDTLAARAIFAQTYKAVKPSIVSNGLIDIKQGRHPLINQAVVRPIDIQIGDKFNILVITGPNTGGKTVCLKMTGLFLLMCYCGIFIPAEQALISLYDNIFCDIGDEQSIEHSLSTFSSHIKNIKEILALLTHNSLVLLDELGVGTDPNEGAALALAIAEYIENQGAKAIITTHFSTLKEKSMISSNYKNASLGFDMLTLKPTYELTMGIPGYSRGLEISKQLGLSESIIEKAENTLTAKNNTEYLLYKSIDKLKMELHKNNENLIEQLKEVEILKKQQETEISKLKNTRLKIENEKQITIEEYIDFYKQKADSYIEQIKELLNNPTDQSLFTARDLRRKTQKIALPLKEKDEQKVSYKTFEKKNIETGDIVFVKSLKKTGQVLNVKEDKIKVNLGSFIGFFLKDDIIVDENLILPNNSYKKGTIKVFKTTKEDSLSRELNLIGLDSLEAESNVISFLSTAFAHNIKEIKIIHGHGKGILKNTTHRIIANSSLVESYRSGDFNEGSTGVTIVKLK